MAIDQRAVELCALLLLQAAPALALDPKVAGLAWDEIDAGIDASDLPARVVDFVQSERIRAWAGFMKDLDDPDRADEWDDYRSETLILAEVVIGSVDVMGGRAGWERALECEQFVGYYREQIWIGAVALSLSAELEGGARFDDLVGDCAEAGRSWAAVSRSREQAANQPWPPPIPPMPPPRPLPKPEV